MADEAEKRVLFVQPSEMGAGITPNRNVSLRLGKPHPSLGFDPAIELAAELTPTEARWLANLLVRKAREAEGGSSQVQ